MFVLDAQARSDLANERAASLRHDLQTSARANRSARRAFGKWLIRVGDWLAKEPRPRCREVSSRA